MSGSTSKNRFPWEDTLILAFRDLQWQKTVAQFMDSLTIDNSVASFLQRKLCSPAPPLLAKLDGAAENATGDVLTSAQQRYFLLEFKSGLSKSSTESGKFIFDLMSLVDPGKQEHEKFVTLSKAGHFLVVGKRADAKAQSKGVNAFGEGRALALTAHPYLNIFGSTVDKTGEISVEKLLRGQVGWDFTEMLAYLQLLGRLHEATEGGAGHPMKVAIATQDGIFWPFSDLLDVLSMSRLFRQSLEHDGKELLNAYLDKFKKLGPFLKDVLPTLKSIRPKPDSTKGSENDRSSNPSGLSAKR
ncbi:hypothetical protein [Pseudomonas botevensis]|uniref:hypothetical protein n=1 Tax=Pseudomonas botevensis TaxID=2842352 RepID=UPI001C3C22EC|nr:hypothetical protein [Pseudomonas botevensis]MBV4473393.1 hypothetical protein [Pseudomonas botevensis]